MLYRFRSTPILEPLERRALLSAGQLDPTFGGGGIVSVAAGGAFEDVAVLPGNKLLAVGTTSNTAGAHSAYLARFNADGSYDTSFGGGDGVATGSFDAHRLALQTDDKILVFGSALARFNADGTPDTSFGGGDGVVVPQAPGDGLGLQLDAKILTVEGAQVTRYNHDGSLDTTFGAGGRVALDTPLGRSPWRTDGGPFDGKASGPGACPARQIGRAHV